MKILYTIPAFNPPHGGYRIIFEHVNRLDEMGHDMYIYNLRGDTDLSWYQLRPEVQVTYDETDVFEMDCVVITSPHAINLQDLIQPHQKCFIFMQMVEHLFRPNDRKWFKECLKFYRSRFPIIHGSHWGERVCREFGRTGPMHYIGNGVNLVHFPISGKPKDGKTVLVEGWESSNPAKDPDHIGPNVAALLKKEGYTILAYSAHTLKTRPDIPNEYYQLPDLPTLNSLYERATILLKATKYDARALSPMEAMTKGTPTVRAIIEGDDDLIPSNSIRCPYDGRGLYNGAKQLLMIRPIADDLGGNCYRYVQANSWDSIIHQLDDILCG